MPFLLTNYFTKLAWILQTICACISRHFCLEAGSVVLLAKGMILETSLKFYIPQRHVEILHVLKFK